MDKINERVQVSISIEDKKRLNELKSIFRVNTYSKVVQIMIRYSK